MPDSNVNQETPAVGGERFDTTHWSLVLLAGESKAPRADEALETLCRTYWQPLYAYVRRQGHDPDEAQDLTQEFFLRLLEKRYLRLANQDRGRFRSFLLKSLKHFLINEWVRGQALKRGGGQKHFPLDEEAAEQRYLQEARGDSPAEMLYDRRWAMTLLENAMERLGDDYAAAGKRPLFDALRSQLLTEATGESYGRLAAALGLSEGAVKVALHRLRQRFRDTVRTEIAHTVASPQDIDEELRFLRAALSG